VTTPDPDELDAYLSAAFGWQSGETYAIRWPFLDKAGGVTVLTSNRIVWISAQHLGHPPSRGRWTCVACDVEGRGPPPAQCPECGDAAWYSTAVWDADRRPMKECFREFSKALLNPRSEA
jgi:hypothetical protein